MSLSSLNHPSSDQLDTAEEGGPMSIPLASKGWRVGMIDQANEMGSLYLSRLGLGRTWKGAGVVVGALLVDRLRSRSSSGGRREGGTLTRTSIRLRPVGRISIHLHRGRLYFVCV